ncbi:MAG: ribokinase [Nocardioidaceae bacterium]|nr:ribokinase [Nocardioidaceae bacterium]
MTWDVVVLGSANLDLVYDVAQLPAPGETVLASAQGRHPGGKGLNQAVAAARAGARTGFVAAVGRDEAGDELVAAMTDAGLGVSLVRRVEQPSGTALITVQSDGENSIVVAPGANGTLEGLTPNERDAVAAASVLVAQLEVPVAVVAEAAGVAREAGATVVLNAAPARPLDDSLLSCVDVLVVNEGEARALAGTHAASTDGVHVLGKALAERVETVVVTLGADGAAWFRRGADGGRSPGLRAELVDTTGAGDAFTGALAAGLAGGLDIAEAVERGVVAGAISVETAGAVPSIPTADQIEARRTAVAQRPPEEER